MLEDGLLLSTKYVNSKNGECYATVPVPVIFENTSPVDNYSPNGNANEFKFKVKQYCNTECLCKT
jgi:hypothetical protein